MSTNRQEGLIGSRTTYSAATSAIGHPMQHGITGREVSLARSPWLPFSEKKCSSHLRLFCFTCAGGSATGLRTLCAALPPDVQGCPVQLPGRGSRLHEPLISKMEVLVESLQNELLQWFDRPFAFFGHSFGGKIAFELTRLLRRRGLRLPSYLFVASCRAPHLPPEALSIRDSSDDDFLAYLERYNGIPKAVSESEELIRLLLPALRNDFIVLQEYRYLHEDPLPIPLTVLSGIDDPTVSASTLEAWSRHTSSTFKIVMMAGDHFFVQTNVVQIARIIRQNVRVIGIGSQIAAGD